MFSRRRTATGGNRGLTLIELLVALSIGAALSATLLALVSGAGGASLRARAGVDEVATHLRAARNTALALQRVVEVPLALQDDPAFVADARSTNAGSGTTPMVFPMVCPAGVQIQGWSTSITFDALGRADRSLNLIIGSDEHEYRLQLFRASGLISVEQL